MNRRTFLQGIIAAAVAASAMPAVAGARPFTLPPAGQWWQVRAAKIGDQVRVFLRAKGETQWQAIPQEAIRHVVRFEDRIVLGDMARVGPEIPDGMPVLVDFEFMPNPEAIEGIRIALDGLSVEVANNSGHEARYVVSWLGSD